MQSSAIFLLMISALALAKASDLGSENELFVEEVGESEVIPIENDLVFDLSRAKRQLEAEEEDDGADYDDEATLEESSGDGGNLYDLDETYDNDEDLYNEHVMPTPRIVPTPVSPSFEEPTRDVGTFGNVVSQPPEQKQTAFDVIKTSLFDEILEGSGNHYDNENVISPTKASEIPTLESKLPDFSPTFPTEDTTVISTSKLPPLNTAPFVKKKLRKYAITAGRSLKIQIPEDTFFDNEDGNTRTMRVDVLQENGTPLRVPWLKYDPKIQTIFALPFDENGIGRYTFNIVATDSKGESVADKLEIVVRQYSGARLVNHEFTIEFSFTNWRPETTKGWEWHMLDKIRMLYNDASSDHILVRKITENPFVFSWTNESLTQQSCPKNEIRTLFSKLIEGNDAAFKSTFGTASQELKDLLGNEMYVKSVAMNYLGTCLMDHDAMPKNAENDDDPENVISSGKEDSVPVIRNPIDRINITAGELLRYKVPEDTCFDQEDGKTSRLSLQLLTTSRRELAPDAWLQFDVKNQEFVGIPLEEEVGREEYQLVCSDANGLSAIDGIEVIVLNRPFNERFGVEFSLQFGPNNELVGLEGLSFGQPILRRDMKVRIVENLANYFGDESTTNIILRVFDPDNGRIVWHNKTLAQHPCDSPDIYWVKNKLLDKDNKVVKALVRHFQPYLKVLDADAVKTGHCVAGAMPPTRPTSSSDSDSPFGSRDTILHGIIPSADYLLTFIIPAVIITCMLILAILLACMLHKKRKAGKLNLFYSEALPPRVPVILQDELFDEHEMGVGNNKQPILLREDLMPGHVNNVNGGLHENDLLLQQGQRPIQVDPYGRGSLGRPTPAYQRRQL